MTPDKYTIKEAFIDVGDGHQLYVYDWGNRHSSKPILFLHGGPGSGVNDGYKQRFEPKQQRVIFFDQRGAGKSLPKGEIKHNTTDNLIQDIEVITDKLKLDRFIITGGSWGSTLALAYAIKHPSRVIAMVLGGIYTGTKEETKFIDQGGYRAFFPEVWDKYLERTPAPHRSNASEYHYKMATEGSPEQSKASAYAYSEMESSLLRLDERRPEDDFEKFDPSDMLIEMHYLSNNCFMPDSYILDNASKIKCPTWLVQGRYDMVCPPKTAYALSKKLPNGHLLWTTAGHGNDRANYDVVRTLLLHMTTSEA